MDESHVVLEFVVSSIDHHVSSPFQSVRSG